MKSTLIPALLMAGAALAAQPKTPVKPAAPANPPNSITNLFDAFGRKPGLTKEFGFSALIQFRGQTILFDAGSNADILKANMAALSIDPADIDLVVVSHSHFDHLNGLDYVLQANPKVKIYFPYDIFWGAPVPFDATGPDSSAADSLPPEMRYFDGKKLKFTINQTGRFWNANIEFVKSSRNITPELSLIATSSEYMGYWSKYPSKSFVEGEFKPKGPEGDAKLSNLSELSLSLRTDSGEVVVVGCSHSAVENILAEAKKVTGRKISLAYGGFHLIPFNRKDLAALAGHIKTGLGVARVAPAHCTGHLAFKVLKEQFGAGYLYAGLGETIGF